MAIQIQFRRGLSTEWSGTNPKLAVAEMGIETDTNLFKIGDGNNFWNDLPYGGIQGDQGTTGYVGSVGFVTTDNVLYVAKNGNDSYAGTSLQYPKLTIRAALESATRGTTIFVKSGDYTEDNPMTVPDFVSLWGDGMRTVTVRPLAPDQNVFYVNNGSYITNMTFKDHVYPAAVISFNPDGSAGVISTSPYVQNCTSMSTTGTGMRVDGNYALGTKSMVVDSFTQYNQGGVGIHLLNRGYAQLVSVFTICCDKGFLCETGGFCSITNSNSSFGNYAFYSNGVSPALYSARTTSAKGGRTFVLDNLTVKPSIGDAVDFGDGNYYTVATSTPFKPGNTTITYPPSSSLWAQQSATLRNARQTVLDSKSLFQVKVINYILATYPGFDFNQAKCSRDVGTIIDSVCYDMVLGSNFQSVKAGTSYYRAVSSPVTGSQKTQTLAAITYLKDQVLTLIQSVPSAYTKLSDSFDTILNIFDQGAGSAPALTYTPPTGADNYTGYAVAIMQANKTFIAEETVAYINSFTYNQSKCYRDTGLIVDSVAFDILHDGTSQSVFAGLQYWNQSGYTGDIARELTTTTAAIAYARDLTVAVVLDASGVSIANTVTNRFNTLLNIINSGTNAVTDTIIPNGKASTATLVVAAYQSILANKSSIVNDTISWITTTYPTFSYNTSTCRRDVGYIIDSVAFDLLHGGNRQSVMSGVYYYGFSTSTSAISNEIPQTTAAYEFIRSISADIVTGKVISVPYQNTVTQVVSVNTATRVEIGLINAKISTITNIILNGPSVAPPAVPIGLTANTGTTIVNAFNLLLANRTFIQAETIAYINAMYIGLTYSTSTCKRDVGYIIDAISYDLTYGGNSQTVNAADAYYDGNYLQIGGSEKLATVSAYKFIRDIIDEVVVNTVVTPRSQATQVRNLTAARTSEAMALQSLLDIVANVVANAYSSTITLETSVPFVVNDKTTITFHQYSLITASSHSFEWIGAGTNINSALPSLGGEPNTDNYAVEVSGGKVNFTGTDQRGDFRIGNDLVINRNLGTISGRTFTKSLFAVMTPYILAIGG
jgi:Major tropism determinant N-terminal domain